MRCARQGSGGQGIMREEEEKSNTRIAKTPGHVDKC
jgi:hypothetical protein